MPEAIRTMSFSKHILSFYKSLAIKAPLPKGVETLNPYHDANAFELCEKFYTRFYNDTAERTIIIGINPGRFGGGITGIPFTDPIRLEKSCGIANTLDKKPELSSDFIYRMVEAYGGVNEFYSKFFFSAVSPLGFTKDGKNLNYYDQKDLQEAVYDFIVQSLQQQLDFGINRKTAFCLGEGQNYKFLLQLNNKQRFFNEVIPLPHPRFIMQYRRKRLDEFIAHYISTLV